MKLVALKHSRNDRYDTLRCIRRDGSHTSAPMPRQGVLPHDLIHYVVEGKLLFKHGFLGLVATGADMSFAMETAHEPNNPSVGDEALQVEAIVESLQAQIWAGSFDEAQFHEGVQGACSMRGCSVPNLASLADGPAQLYEEVVRLGQIWVAVPYYGELALELMHL
jgi:hypothetical protein